MFAIINWMDTVEGSDLSPVLAEEGRVMLFGTKRSAEKYAREELNGKWVIIQL